MLSHKILAIDNLPEAQDFSNFSYQNRKFLFGYASKISSLFLCDRISYHTQHIIPEYIGFGKILRKEGSKIYEIQRIDGSGTLKIHAQQLEKVLISEYFLKRMLKL